MDPLVGLIALTCVTGIGSGVLGAGLATLFDLDSNRTMSMLLSFAAGLMLAVISFDFIPEAMELDEGPLHIALVVAAIAVGALIVGGLDRMIDRHAEKRAHCCAIDDPLIAEALDEEIRHEHMMHHDDIAQIHTHGHAHGHGHHIPYEGQSEMQLKMAGFVMAVAIALHNLPAGISIGASFSGPDGSMVAAGVIIAILIGIHSIPESMAMAVPLLKSGLPKARTLLVAAFVGFLIVVGALIGFALGEVGTFWLAMSLAFASGAMLYVLFGEILPEAFLLFHSKRPAVAVIGGLVLGLVLVQI